MAIVIRYIVKVLLSPSTRHQPDDWWADPVVSYADRWLVGRSCGQTDDWTMAGRGSAAVYSALFTSHGLISFTFQTQAVQMKRRRTKYQTGCDAHKKCCRCCSVEALMLFFSLDHGGCILDLCYFRALLSFRRLLYPKRSFIHIIILDLNEQVEVRASRSGRPTQVDCGHWGLNPEPFQPPFKDAINIQIICLVLFLWNIIQNN